MTIIILLIYKQTKVTIILGALNIVVMLLIQGNVVVCKN